MKILIISILVTLTYFLWVKLYKDENFWGGEREALSDFFAEKNFPLISELFGCPYCCAFWTNTFLLCLPVGLVSIYATVVSVVITAVIAYCLKKEEEESI